MPDSQDQFTQATELVELGRLDEALALFQALLKTDSNNAAIWNNIGIIQFRQGKIPRHSAHLIKSSSQIHKIKRHNPSVS